MATETTAEQALYEDLLSLYARAGAEITYETDSGEVKAYWPKRFLQAVKRAEKNGDLLEMAERLVLAAEPSRGFFILKKAGRLDLTVEALVIDGGKPYWGEIDAVAVNAARRRLADHGYSNAFETIRVEKAAPSGHLQVQPGTSFDLRVTVNQDGVLSIALV